MLNIDKNNIYTIDSYTFKNFSLLSDEEIEMVWKWRNDEKIRLWMFNTSIIPFDSHKDFVKRLKDRDDVYYWLVYDGINPIGVLDIIDIDNENNEVEPGYYINPDLLDSGVGLFFNYYYRYFLFNCINVDVVKGHVLYDNLRALSLSLFFNLEIISEQVINGKKFVNLRGSKYDFEKVDKNSLIKSYVKFMKEFKCNEK